MNIHEYMEKRASRKRSLRQGYLQMVHALKSKVMGENPTSMRVIPASALQTILTPVQMARDIPQFVSDASRGIQYGKRHIRDLRKELKNPNLPADKKEYMKKDLAEVIEDIGILSSFRSKTLLGAGAGYGTLGYGGYKGGQKVKGYIQDKKRKK